MSVAETIPLVPSEGLSPESLFDEFTVRLPTFEGPLDLLLHLVRKHEIDLFNLPINFITGEYLKYLRVMETLDVTVSSEFLVMAATLVHIKSQMLLPSQFLRSVLTDQEYKRSLQPEDPRFHLVQALLSKQALDTIASELEVRDQWARSIYYPNFERPVDWLEGEPIYDLSDMNLNKLLTAFQRALTRDRQPGMTVLTPRLSVGDVLREIRHLHRSGQLSFTFSELVQVEPQAYRVVAVFLALLELARQGRVRLVQPEPNADIAVEWEETLTGLAA